MFPHNIRFGAQVVHPGDFSDVRYQVLLGNVSVAAAPEDGQPVGVPHHPVGPPVRVDELVPALGKPAHDRDTGRGAAFGNDRRVDRRAIGSLQVRPCRRRGREARTTAVIQDGHGLDAHWQQQTSSRCELIRSVVLPRRSAHQVAGGRRDTVPPHCRGGHSGGGRSDAVQGGEGGETAKHAAPTRRSATHAVRAVRFFRMLWLASDDVHSRSSHAAAGCHRRRAACYGSGSFCGGVHRTGVALGRWPGSAAQAVAGADAPVRAGVEKLEGKKGRAASERAPAPGPCSGLWQPTAATAAR
jgi:hypothetical protein